MYKNRSLLLTVITFALICTSAGAQNLYMRKLDSEKGVKAHDIYSVFQDSKQYLWFATDAGIWRYDGKSYVSYTTANGLPDNVVFGFTEDRQQRIWLRMYSNKLAYIQNERITVLPCSNKLARMKKNEVAISLQVDVTNTVYLSHLNSPKLIKIAPPYRDEDIEQVSLPIEPCSHFLYETPSGEILIGKILLEEGGPPKIKVFAQRKTSCIPLDKNYREMPRLMVARQKDKTYLVGIGNFLYSYKEHVLKKLMGFSNAVLYAMYDRQHHLWVGVYDQGLYLYRNTDTAFAQPENYLSGAVPNSFIQDNEGAYWISTLKNGIYYAPYNDVYLKGAGNGLAENITCAFYDTASQRLYCFSSGVMYMIDRDGTEKKTGINLHPVQTNEILAVLHLDRKRLLCIGRHSFIFEKNTGKKTPLVFGSETNPSLSCAYSINDTIFCGRQKSLLYFDQKISGLRMVTTLESRINCIHPFGLDCLLIGTENGIFRYDLRKNSLKPAGPLPANTSVKGIEYSARHRGFLVVLKNGSVYLTDSLLTTIKNKIAGIAGHTVKNVHNDKQGNLWLATNNGIYRIDEELRTHNINQEHGLPDNLVNAVSVHHDTVFVSAEKGLITFSRGKNFFNDSPPVLYYKGASINGVPRGTHTSFELGYNENFIKIACQALNYRINSDVEYRYFLSGVDHQWQSTRNNTVEYTTLPPGHYNFFMYALNNDGVKSRNTIRLNFTILPPFWNTWWFVLLALLLISTLLTVIFISRVRQIKKREREKNELTKKIAETEMQALRSQMNPHFIFNAINSIQHLVLINEPLTANYYLTKFSKLMRNVLEQSRMELVPLQEELENIRLYLTIEALRFEEKFSYEIRLSHNLVPENVFVPPMIIQPFIENAIWHGLLLKKGDKRLLVDVYYQNDYLHIEIDDNGIGRGKAMNYSSAGLKKESLGMKITMQRLHLLEKNQQIKTFIHIEDKFHDGKDPAGTKAIIQLPIIHHPYDKSSYNRR